MEQNKTLICFDYFWAQSMFKIILDEKWVNIVQTLGAGKKTKSFMY